MAFPLRHNKDPLFSFVSFSIPHPAGFDRSLIETLIERSSGEPAESLEQQEDVVRPAFLSFTPDLSSSSSFFLPRSYLTVASVGVGIFSYLKERCLRKFYY